MNWRDSVILKPCVGGCSAKLFQIFFCVDWIFSHCFYSFDMCPNNCSGRGECKISNSSNIVQCECSENWKGEACDIPHCVNNCGFPHRGICNSSDIKGCSCFPEWQGRSFFLFSSNLRYIPSLINCRLVLVSIPFMLVKDQVVFRFSHLFIGLLTNLWISQICDCGLSRIVEGFAVLCNSFMKVGELGLSHKKT